jgi:photosystem II stability/assembly factor-like uncharacterized protein/uncharacterized protein YodC (DUF2158 family)
MAVVAGIAVGSFVFVAVAPALGATASKAFPPTRDVRRPASHFDSKSKTGVPIAEIETVTPGNDELMVDVFISGPTALSVTARCGAKSVTVDNGQPGEMTVTGLKDGRGYACRAYGTNAVGNGPKSRPFRAKPAVVVPGEPSITSVTPGNGSFTVSYDAPPSYGATITGYTASCGSAMTTVGGSILTATVSGLTIDGSYTCTLFATDSKGNGPSNQWSGLAGPPAAPHYVSVLSQDGQLTVEFEPTVDFAVSYTATCGSRSTTIRSDADDIILLRWATITGLADGTSYSCTVFETNAAGSGPASDPVSRVPDPPTSSPTSSTDGWFVAVACPTTSECVAVGAGLGAGLIEVSSDGGRTFADVPVPAGTSQLKAVTCPDASHCVAVGGSSTVVTTDGGATWTSEFAGVNLSAVSCVNDNDCVADGYQGLVALPAVTTDGGSTWTLSDSHDQLIDLTCNSLTCFGLELELPSVLTTGDGGQTWGSISLPDDTGSPNSLACLPSTSACVIVGPDLEGGLSQPSDPATAFLTVNDGQSWSNVSSAFPSGSWTIDDVSCPTSTTCYGIGFAGTGAISTDGGQTWTSVAGPTTVWTPDVKETLAGFQSLSCPSASDCVMVGSSSPSSSGPAIAFTDDGATSWNPATFG